MQSDRSADDQARSSQRLPVRVVAWALVFASIISLWVFRPVLYNGFVHWDDHIYIAELVRMQRFSWSSLRWMWTSLQPFYLQPIAWMTHLADFQIWGLNAVGHHATNWMLHGVYVALVGTLVWMLTGKVASLRPPERLAMSTGIALVCGIHPLQAESVAWVAARNGLLCSLWMVAALCAYVRSVGDNVNPKRGWWWTAVALYAVALLTKPFAVSLPLVMLAIDFFPLRRHLTRSIWRLVGEKSLMIALSAAGAVGAIAAQEHVEGVGEYGLGVRVLVAMRGVVFYLWKLVWPAWLSPFYPLSSHVGLRSAEFMVPILFCAVVTVLAVWQRKRVPVLLAAWGSYLALVLPVSGLVQVGGQAVADRYAYLAMVPLLLALGSGLVWMSRRGLSNFRVSLCVAIGVWLAYLGLQTREQIDVWHDDLSLWGAALSHFPNDPLANYNLAMAFLGARRLTDARSAAERAVACSDPHAAQMPMARATLGLVYLKTHDYVRAADQLQQAIAADATLWAAHYNLACTYARMGRKAEAFAMLQTLLATQPEYAALAARDRELKALRSDPEYAARFVKLIGPAGR